MDSYKILDFFWHVTHPFTLLMFSVAISFCKILVQFSAPVDIWREKKTKLNLDIALLKFK